MHSHFSFLESSAIPLTVVGISYRKSDTSVRSLFALDEARQKQLLELSKSKLAECLILSTCNRTEIYGLTEDAQVLLNLLSSQVTPAHSHLLKDLAYIKHGAAAVEHIFQVASGLDSQILGDYEILGQFKQAVHSAREAGTIGSYMDRLSNTTIQCAKKIKSNTALNGGTVSVAYAAIQYIKEHFPSGFPIQVILVGTGKFGRHTCKYLRDYLPKAQITLVNRTLSKAIELAEATGAKAAPLTALADLLPTAQVILVATHAPQPIVNPESLSSGSDQLILDLSIPNNVHPGVKNLPGVTLINVDDLAKVKDETLAQREREVPQAQLIISEFQGEFNRWLSSRQVAPALKAIKTTLKNIQTQRHSALPVLSDSESRIQEIVNKMAVKLKSSKQQGCYYLEAINEFIA